jgi:aldehyde dehydrogenase
VAVETLIDPIYIPALINGAPVDTAERILVCNPARPGEVVGTIPRCQPYHVNQAVAAAKDAQPAWAARPFAERAELLSVALEALGLDIDARAALYVRENGKTLAEAKGELASVLRRHRNTLQLARELQEGRRLEAPHGRTEIRYDPYGVVVSIIPWNSPAALAPLQIFPALLAGNTMVVKPPETCPLAVGHMITSIASALPAGVINRVTGLPAEIGDALTTHPDVDKIAFTGSIASARHIMANAAQSIKGVTLELGGNDPAILLDDMPFDDMTLQRLARAVYEMAGQVCLAVKRIYVPEARIADFMSAFIRTVDRIVVGDGLSPSTTMGPLHSARAKIQANALIEQVRDSGCEVHALGIIQDEATFSGGHFVRPHVVTGLPDNSPLVTGEQFCPVVPVMTYRSLDEVIARANCSEYGLGASVWSADISRAIEVGRRIQAGTVFVNAHGPHSVNGLAPYGGVKQSGIGRKGGFEGVAEFLQLKTITTFEER